MSKNKQGIKVFTVKDNTLIEIRAYDSIGGSYNFQLTLEAAKTLNKHIDSAIQKLEDEKQNNATKTIALNSKEVKRYQSKIKN